MTGALDGIVVADFSRVLAGPYATMLLADLGATVVKVERPGSGDDTRAWGPPFAADGQSTYFQSVNRNKASIALDLGAAGDRAIAQALAARADVLVENHKPGALTRFGLDYAQVRALNPAVIYCSISGFGSGAGADLPGYDLLVQAMGGLMSITGTDEPTKAGVAVVDVLTGLHAAVGILAALHHRDRTGEGQRIEATLLTALQSSLVNQASAFVGAGSVPTFMGNAHPSIAPYEVFAAADRSIILAVGNDAQFARLVEVLGLPALAADARFATNAARVENRMELKAHSRRSPGHAVGRRVAGGHHCRGRAVRAHQRHRAGLRAGGTAGAAAGGRGGRSPPRGRAAAGRQPAVVLGDSRGVPQCSAAGGRGPGRGAGTARAGGRMTVERRATAQDAVLVALRSDILTGELGPGDQIVQELLAERYGVSRVPLREALKTLESEGQVVYHPHRGYFVAELSVADLLEVYRLRALLEAEAIRAAVPTFGDDDVDALADLAHEVDLAAGGGDVIAMTAANRRFHFAIFDAAGMPRLSRLLRQLWEATDAYRALYFQARPNRDRVAGEHAAMVQALRDRDAEALVALHDRHRDNSVDAVRAILEAPRT